MIIKSSRKRNHEAIINKVQMARTILLKETIALNAWV